MKKLLFSFILSAIFISTQAQLDISYQTPPKEILELADVDLPPSFYMNAEGTYALFMYRNQYKSIEELSEKELRLGGLRINPVTNSPSRVRYYTHIEVFNVKKQKTVPLHGLPENARLSNFAWSPDQSMMAFTNTTPGGVELWVLDISKGRLNKLTTDNLNANLGTPFEWFQDGKSLLVKVLPGDRKPLIDETLVVPSGPTVSVNEGQKAQNRTYQDLLENKNDEFNFEQLALSELVQVDLKGNSTPWKKKAMYRGLNFSPDGNYILVTTIEKPFSYLVPFYRFPSKTVIYDKGGAEIKKMLEVHLIEDLPQGFMAEREGMRDLAWRTDKPSTLYWVEALDGGDPSREAQHRDEVFELNAPFQGEKQSLLKTINRFSGITWGNDNVAVATDYWWNTRNTKSYLFSPSDQSVQPEIIFDRNYQDRYNDPGYFVTVRNNYGRNVLLMETDHLYLIGRGYCEEGIRPFLDQFNLTTKSTDRLWRADGKETLENIVDLIDPAKGKLLTRIESKSQYPNYYFRNIQTGELTRISNFKNPFESLQNVHKEVIKYQREDGLELSGTLYLPTDYQEGEKYPMIMWAYPREYKDKSTAGQVTSSPHEFIYPYYGSPVFWVTRGYVVLDDAAFPVVGEGENEPNDTFVEQLVANAKAAIDAVDEMGYIDRNKVAVGGHSYGAFMTANLLSHSNLFAAGIARSGAYNRTLTPFGFQSEERNYWEAPEIYYEMSPFMHAHKMKTPLLLIHGAADNNSGTYTMQSERYFNALKGLGATVRLVLLPRESHGYAARESVLHVLWEQDQWLEKYLKETE
ncbi:MAG: prolyl oligopeptidase family serine peptidase [Bacteroidales bacterium]|jgi:dipeptidyl aminopeptidase/acylaminoacyl peptidase|nr:prolyl oligopeptidase family serine peptidase [Bacteroidales bacterium]